MTSPYQMADQTNLGAASPDQPVPKTVVFLGAGASCADGAPLQGELFRDYFLHYNAQPERRLYHEWDRELATFFWEFFGINVDESAWVKKAVFPTFEEVLGIIELATSQDESFRGWGTAHLLNAQQRPRLHRIHEVLILLIAEILDQKLRGNATHHPKLIRTLHESGRLQNTSFMSLNYDILIDNALLTARNDCGIDLDYAIGFMNPGDDWEIPRPARSVQLFKLHGSLNWLYCPTCRALRITPKEKGVCHLKWQPGECLCSRCETLAVPIIIPPTYFKALSNLYLRQVWHAAEQKLHECDQIIFCGYSFPDADVHIRYLLKRIEVNRNRTPEVFIVNEHEGKASASREAERTRFLRFFRDKARIHWLPKSFESFCADPVCVP